MSKIVLFISFLFCCNVSIGQTYYPYQDIKLDKPADYKDAEPIVLHAATFLLSTPYKNTDPDRIRALQFLVKWVTGTTDYKFDLQGKAQNLSQERDLFALYTVAMVKFCIENKALSTNAKVVESSACKLVLAYCDNTVNNFPLKKKQRKLLEN